MRGGSGGGGGRGGGGRGATLLEGVTEFRTFYTIILNLFLLATFLLHKSASTNIVGKPPKG